MINSTKKKKKIKKLLLNFDGIKKTGKNKWKAKCPAHKDKNPSLSITLKNKKILIKCHAGCKTEDILSAKGLSYSDLYFNENSESVVNTTSKSLQRCNSGCCLKDYAKFKSLPTKFLKEIGLSYLLQMNKRCFSPLLLINFMSSIPKSFCLFLFHHVYPPLKDFIDSRRINGTYFHHY